MKNQSISGQWLLWDGVTRAVNYESRANVFNIHREDQRLPGSTGKGGVTVFVECGVLLVCESVRG